MANNAYKRILMMIASTIRKTMLKWTCVLPLTPRVGGRSTSEALKRFSTSPPETRHYSVVRPEVADSLLPNRGKEHAEEREVLSQLLRELNAEGKYVSMDVIGTLYLNHWLADWHLEMMAHWARKGRPN